MPGREAKRSDMTPNRSRVEIDCGRSNRMHGPDEIRRP
jgi:hypothetical protein